METIDFLNPERRRRYTRMVILGYVLIGLAIVMMTTVVVFIAYGFSYKNGQVIQDGMVYLSSTPNPANIYVNGLAYGSNTDTRILLQSGTYTFKLQRSGYRDWQRTIVIPGGQIVYYEYPFLIPNNLVTTTVSDYDSAPSLMTQSLDQRWLVVAQDGSLTAFNLFDLNSPLQVPTSFSLPDNLLTATTLPQSLQVVGWSNDNSHVLLKHLYGSNTEYILMDISTPAQSINLTKQLSLPTTGIDIQLNNELPDQYLVLNSATDTLYQDSLSSLQLQLYFNKILAFKSYSNNNLLYATPDPSNTSVVNIDFYDGSNSYLIRRAAANTPYLLNLTTYAGNLYVAITATSENTAYIYENPVSQITDQQIGVAVPVEVFRISQPNYLSFSDNTQYVLFENGSNVAVYDAENAQGYSYSLPTPLDSPQTHLTWMDGAQLMYVSNKQLNVMDYDGNNRQVLVSADPQYQPIFDPSYKYLFMLEPSVPEPGHELLTSTPLRIPSDL
jgi:hypothetical protein